MNTSFPRTRESRKACILKPSYVYILASKRNGTLYIGVTTDLIARVYEHKNDLVDGFTKKYNVHTLVYYKECENIVEAIAEEKRLKKWNRKWKLQLIENVNPEWKDLSEMSSSRKRGSRQLDSRSGRE